MPEAKETIFYVLEKADILEYAFIKENYDDKNPEIQISSTLGFSFVKETSVLRCQYGVIFKQKEIAFLKCVLYMDYLFREDSVEQLKRGSSIWFSTDILKFFGTNSIGTMRGVLLAKNKAHGFDLVLPPINLNQIIKEPLMVE